MLRQSVNALEPSKDQQGREGVMGDEDVKGRGKEDSEIGKRSDTD